MRKNNRDGASKYFCQKLFVHYLETGVMRRHRFLAHVADVRLFVEGDSLKELFTAAVEGMNNLIKKNGCAGSCSMHETVILQAQDTTSLLIDFLSEVLTLSHVNRTVYCRVDFKELSPTNLHATIVGCPVDGFDEDIKAVTYHEANVVENEAGNYETVIVFDI